MKYILLQTSSSNLGTGFTRKCIRFCENFAQCRATQQHSSDYLQVELYEHAHSRTVVRVSRRIKVMHV